MSGYTVNVATGLTQQDVISRLQDELTASREREAALRARVEALTAALGKSIPVIEQVIDWNVLEIQRYSVKWGVDWQYSDQKQPDICALIDLRRAILAAASEQEGQGDG